ncbi:putative ribosomal protein s17 protein [Phaeoacremonium minimum UCRPA7]|uniref:Putative ribosomal protein s17 protein n=1 Tax=Phaeoacremonium minimum (strain UCR-PA7) TaxID=1286976 RepID=R8BTH8_PHAM7|nr:putative ribosomal protein s17 protein [Phaeoacremonium minimum UCRPA7]EOO02580.1 putative ribosomal protein s17 protein [Phaeoacremonium minimum UCRPA7]
MISTIILFPSNDQTIESGKDFTIQVQVNGLQAGSFTNAQATYYSAPQALNGGGNVIGHTHVTVQDLGNSLNPKTPPDPTQFAFFKGINDAGNGNGLLTADVVGGLPEGNYRICTLTSASNHQPVIMPVAQRGSQDDCTKFVVNGNNNTINAAANNGDKGEAAAALAASAVDLGPGALTATAAGAQATGDANANQNQGQDQNNADANNQNQGNANANANANNQNQQGQNQGNANANANANANNQNQGQNQQAQNQAQNQQGQNQGQNQANANANNQNPAQDQGNANANNQSKNANVRYSSVLPTILY